MQEIGPFLACNSSKKIITFLTITLVLYTDYKKKTVYAAQKGVKE